MFVSYCHRQSNWVHQRLIPVLRASGATVSVDIDHFEAGQTVIGQMDGLQDSADRHILVLTKDYVGSPYCQHELAKAIEADPGFATCKVLPIRLDDTPTPPDLAGMSGLGSEPLYINLQADTERAPWDLLIKSAGLDLPGTDAPTWLRALDQTATHLERGESVNLVVRNGDVDWRFWLDQLRETRFNQLAAVDLEHPRAVPRNGLIGEILTATGRSHTNVPPPPDDLPLLADAFEHGSRSYLALKHFDSVKHRDHYGLDFFSSLRWAVMDARQLVLLAHSDVPVADLLPRRHKLSAIDFKTVELG